MSERTLEELYQALLDLAKQLNRVCSQSELTDSEIEQVEALLAKRRILIAEITEHPQQPAAGLKPVIEEIIRLDDSTRELLGPQLARVKQQLQKIKKGKQTNKAYRSGPTQIDGFFIDQKK